MLKVFDVPCGVRTYQRPWPSYTPPCRLARADATYAYVWYTQNVSRRTGVGGTWHAKTGLPSILYCPRTESPGVCYPLQAQKRESQTHISNSKILRYENSLFDRGESVRIRWTSSQLMPVSVGSASPSLHWQRCLSGSSILPGRD